MSADFGLLLLYLKENGRSTLEDIKLVGVADEQLLDRAQGEGLVVQEEEGGTVSYSLSPVSERPPEERARAVKSPPAVPRRATVAGPIKEEEVLAVPPRAEETPMPSLPVRGPGEASELLNYIQREKIATEETLRAVGFTRGAIAELTGEGRMVSAKCWPENLTHILCALASDGTGDLSEFSGRELSGLLSCIYLRLRVPMTMPNIPYSTLIEQHKSRSCYCSFHEKALVPPVPLAATSARA